MPITRPPQNFSNWTQSHMICVRRESSAPCSHSGTQDPFALWQELPIGSQESLSLSRWQMGKENKDCIRETFIDHTWKGLTSLLPTSCGPELYHVAILNCKYSQAVCQGQEEQGNKILVSSSNLCHSGHSHFPHKEMNFIV